MCDKVVSLVNSVNLADSSASLMKAVQALAAVGSVAAIPTLIAALSYNNPGAAVAAVDGLVKIGEPCVPAILEQLDGHNYTARAWAIRALARIGDARGFPTLLGAATADFALSVRRAAAKGLGTLNWQQFGVDEIEIAQAEAMDALLFVCEDEEWIVRYAAVAGLEAVGVAVWSIHPDWQSPILTKLEQMAEQDAVWAVRGRVWLAQQQLQAIAKEPPHSRQAEPANDVFVNWRSTLDNVYRRKSQERPLAEGDPRRYRGLAASITTSHQAEQ